MNIISNIKKELAQEIELDYKKGCSRFFKEEIKLLGVRTPKTRKIARKYFPHIKKLEKKEVYKICEELLDTNISEYRTIAFDWIYTLRNTHTKQDFIVFEKWLKKYVKNWASCDDFCTHTLGFLLRKYPELYENNKKWSISKNPWERRAAAVTIIHPLKKGEFLNRSFEIAKIMMQDKEDLVQKGYGWMLKEAANKYQKEVFDFVMKHKEKMPRTALRYAIEKMPKEMKQKAMKK